MSSPSRRVQAFSASGRFSVIRADAVGAGAQHGFELEHGHRDRTIPGAAGPTGAAVRNMAQPGATGRNRAQHGPRPGATGPDRANMSPSRWLLPNEITQPLSRLGAAAQNALEVARFGGLATDEEPSPYEIAAEHRVYRLRHYYPDADPAREGSPVLLVPPMMLAAEVYDVSAADKRGDDAARAWRSTPGSSTSARPSTSAADSSARSPTTCWRSPTRSTACARRPGATSTSAATRRAGCSCYQAAAYRATSARAR